MRGAARPLSCAPGGSTTLTRIPSLSPAAEVAIAELLGPIAEDAPNGASPRLVAVKTLKPHVLESEEDVMDFIDEVRVLIRLNHR